MHGIIAKWDIAANHVHVVIRQRRFLKALGEYRGVGIELLGNPRRDRIQFNAGSVAALHVLWHQSKEVTEAHCRFKNLRASANTNLA